MRQIILDTETTGLEPEKGHRIIEIGCIELIDRQLTNNNFHCYVNPQRAVEPEAFAISGITNEFLQDKPLFSTILNDFLNYIQGSELIAHNADFDVGFINHEIQLIKNPKFKTLDNYVTIFDTLALARKMFPGQRNTLDALCKRYKIDLSARKFHGALLDAQLLAEVYLSMTGGQRNLFSDSEFTENFSDIKTLNKIQNKNRPPLPIIFANNEEIAAHEAILTKIKATPSKTF